MRTAVIAAVILAAQSLALSDTLHVPGDYPTIQAAIDAAQSGDTVSVAPGTYLERVKVGAKALLIKSEQGSARTVIDGGTPGSGCVVRFKNAVSGSLLQGFTLANGKGSDGGGINCSGDSLKIVDCLFLKNTASNFGGAIYSNGCKVQFIDCGFVENEATMQGGGAAFHAIDSNPTLDFGVVMKRCRFYRNRSYYRGGAIRSKFSDLWLEDCDITQNASNDGGGIYSSYGGLLMTRCAIQKNTSFFDGGGIESGSGYLDLTDCRVADNQANHGGGGGISNIKGKLNLRGCTFYGNHSTKNGGGACIKNESWVNLHTFVNCVFWNNSSPTGSQISLGGWITGGLTLHHSDIMGGKKGVAVGSNCTLTWGPGMIESDPLFSDPEDEDFHLTIDSPCRDSGDTLSAFKKTDMEGDPRVANEVVDMGADEFYPHLYQLGRAVVGTSLKIKAVGMPGDGVSLFLGSALLDYPYPTPFGLWCLHFPVIGPIPLPDVPSSGVLAVPCTVPEGAPAPYELPMQALIGGRLSNPWVMEILE